LTEIAFISVVDDDPSVRRSLSSLIRSAGLQVMLFGSAEEFLRYGDPQQWACLVLDMKLPGISGLELQSYLSAAGYDIPTIFITAGNESSLKEVALAAGAIDFLQKPFSDEVLIETIQSAVVREEES
jgi:FixJ family two-component response regulator